MAFVCLSEYTNTGRELKGNLSQSAAEPALAQQRVAIGGGSVQSANVNAKTRLLRLHADAICSVAVGNNPTATTSSKRLAANQTEYFAITPEQVVAGCSVAVITNT